MSRTKAENKAIREKVQQLIQEGWPAKQSQAIAFRMFRDNELSTSIADVPRLSRKENNQRKALNKNRIKGTKAIQKAHEETMTRMFMLRRIRKRRLKKK